ncbi:MAG: hypothetical protein MOB07_04430, partial [Acidobacteria bacterium]|nr:hypothetical protein [Acidobacteriota bacterium]
DPSEADFVIDSGSNPQGGCADIKIDSRPYRIRISDTVAQMSDENYAAAIAHELGHRIGLHNATGCSGSDKSIMQGVGTGCIPRTTVVKPIDIAESNRNYDPESRASCIEDVPTSVVAPIPCDSSADCSQFSWSAILPYDFCINDCPNGYYLQFNSSGEYCCSLEPSPIVIDVAGNGFSMTSAEDGVDFDFAGTGRKLHLSWTAAGSDDAWLVLDRNGNGKIDSAKEMFGNVTQQPHSRLANGFLALAEFDQQVRGGNGDGQIDNRDSIFANLRLWIDTNHNGISERTELHTLSEFGLAILELRFRESNRTDEYGNRFKYRAKVRGLRGEDGGRWAWDVFLMLQR